jgi:hypothetical protein
MIYFTQTHEGFAPKDYRFQKLKFYLSPLRKKDLKAVQKQLSQPLSLADQPYFQPIGHLDPAGHFLAASKKETEALFPLLEGEVLQSESLCALLINGPSLNNARICIEQVTNFATLYLEVPNKRIANGAIADEAAGQGGTDAALADQQLAAFEWILALATKLADSIVSMLGSYIFDKVKSEVFTQIGISDLPTYYEKVYEQIRIIIAAAFDAHYLKEVKDLSKKFADTIEFYNNMGRKESDFLIVKNTSFDLMVKSDALKSPGTFHYAEAAVLHTMILKEQYKRLVEAGSRPDELERAKRYISAKANEFAGNILKKRETMINERMDMISKDPFFRVTPSWNSRPGRVIAGVHEGGFRDDGFRPDDLVGPMHNRFEDSANGFWNSMWFNHWREIGSPRHSWTWVNNNLKKYRAFMHTQTIAQMEPLVQIAGHLRAIAVKPVG